MINCRRSMAACSSFASSLISASDGFGIRIKGVGDGVLPPSVSPPPPVANPDDDDSVVEQSSFVAP